MNNSTLKWHPHLHVLATDGLFSDTGTFYVMKDVDLKPLEALFRAELFKMLKKKGKITDELINKLSTWKHSGFSVDNGVWIEKDDREGREAIVQYMARNVFSTRNITYIEKDEVNLIDVSKYQSKNVPSLTWRECIALKRLENLERRSLDLPTVPV